MAAKLNTPPDGPSQDPLKKLFDEGLGKGPEEHSLPSQRAKFIVRLDTEIGVKKAHGFRALWQVGMGASFAAAVAAWFVLHTPNTANQPQVAENRKQPAQRTKDVAPINIRTKKTFSFDDGSQVVATRGTTMMPIVESGPTVTVPLISGKISATVEPKSKRAWTFIAGPYQVRVLGTVLHVAWNPDDKNLNVSVDRGLVKVTGGVLPKGGIAVAAGDQLKATQDTHVLNQAEIESTAVKPKPSNRISKRWLRLAQQSDFKGAMKAIGKYDKQRILTTLSAPHLMLLADAARLTRDVEYAEDALQAVRGRFKRSKVATDALFQLARLASDHERDLKKTIHLLTHYLTQAPRGTYAEKALGRLMIAYQQSGAPAQAKPLAQKYLKQYPKGTFARSAQSVLSASAKIN